MFADVISGKENVDSSVAPRVPDTSSSSTHKPLRLSYITHSLARETGIDLGSTIDVSFNYYNNVWSDFNKLSTKDYNLIENMTSENIKLN